MSSLFTCTLDSGYNPNEPCFDMTASLTTWDVSGVTDMSSMFAFSSFSGTLEYWDVSNVTSMDYMFHEAFISESDLSGWCMSNITTEPSEFSSYVQGYNNTWPVWGTCP